MNELSDPTRLYRESQTLHPKQAQALGRAVLFLQIAGVSAIVVRYGLRHVTQLLHWELGLVVILAMLVLTASTALRYKWSLMRPTFAREQRVTIVICSCWLSGIVGVLIFGPFLPIWLGEPTDRGTAMLAVSELLLVAHGVASIVLATRRAAAGGWNPAMILVLSFALLVCAGTVLLMLPRARAHTGDAEAASAPFLVALFTATSAGCVTGLVVEPTGTYWSRLGQTVILCLFQIGGLGIMTCGAFFAVAAGRQMQIRESATLRELLDSERVGDVRRLVLAILAFTAVSELIGALLLSGLWSELSLRDQIYYSVFHSVSAFCNAGFSLTPNSFDGLATRWQVWFALSGLIIVGGLGFAVLYNLALVVRSRFQTLKRPPLFNLSRTRVRLTLMSCLVVTATVALLMVGAVGYYLLESTGPRGHDPLQKQMADAWFQSVTFRTAGFNSVDHGQMQPATKLFAVLLMFIGASPGSTGGGVKTVCFVLSVLAVVSILRGRNRVEILHRTIPTIQVNRALTIISIGIFVVMVTTILLVLFENEPTQFLDHLFEATSAFATVGVSTGITGELKTPSKLVIVATMFLGRVGPLTLLIALAGKLREARYDYPTETVSLG